MKILMCLPYFPAPNTGTGNAVYGLTKGLQTAGASIIVLAEGNNSAEISEYKEVSYLVFRKNKFLSEFTPSKYLRQYIKNNNTPNTLVILNGIYVPYMFFLSSLLYKLGIPFIHVPHSVYSDTSFIKSRYKKKIYFNFFEKRLIKRALAVQMFSEIQLEQLSKLVTFKNTVCLPNGVDFDLLDTEFKPAIPKLNNKIKIIFLGRKQVFTKGLDLLIQAFSKLSNPSLELIIQGTDIGETDTLLTLINELDVKNIHLLDNFEGNVVSYLKDFDMLILPSRYEAFGMIVAESMLAKIPVLVSREAGSAHHVDKANAGLVFEPTVDGILSSLHEMMDGIQNWKMMGENGYLYVDKYLRWERIGERAFNEYSVLLSRSSIVSVE